MSEMKIEGGKLNAMGMDINISNVIGEKIVDQWMASISEEDIGLILKAIDEEAFSRSSDDRVYFKQKKKNSEGYYDRYEDTPLWKAIQEEFQVKFCDRIMKRMEDILESESYQARVERIAQDILEYAVNGYKEDIIKRIRERLVGNVLTANPYFDGMGIKEIISKTVINGR